MHLWRNKIKEENTNSDEFKEVRLHTKICETQSYDEYVKDWGERALADQKQDKNHIEAQKVFYATHLPCCYEYHENLLKDSKSGKFIHQKNKTERENENEDEEEKIDTTFNSTSCIRVDLEGQDKIFIKQLLSNPFPKITALQFNGIESLQEREFITLLGKNLIFLNFPHNFCVYEFCIERVTPEYLWQLCLCSKMDNKTLITKRILKYLNTAINSKITKALTLQGFRIQDWFLSEILENWKELEKICIKNCLIFSKNGEKAELNVSLKSLSTSQNLKKLNLSMNKFGKACLKNIVKDLKGDQGDQAGILLTRLLDLDLYGNQRRHYEHQWWKVKKRYNYETEIHGKLIEINTNLEFLNDSKANNKLNLNKTAKTKEEKADLSRKWSILG